MIAPLVSLVAALRAAPDAASRAAAAAGLLRDRDALRAVAAWSVEAPDEYEAAMMDAGGVHGCRARVEQLRAAVRRVAETIPRPRPEASRPDDGADDEATDPGPPLDDVLASVEVPDGWMLNPKGVWFAAQVDGETVFRRATCTPCAVVEVLESLRDGTERVRLRWRRGSGVWTEQVFPRSVLRDQRKVVALSDVGLDVSSGTARQVVGWLSAQEAHNERTVARCAFSDRMGWQGTDGALGFLAGRQYLPPEGAAGRRVVFDDADSGRLQVAASLEPCGTLDGWRAALEWALPHPIVMLAVYAALATPFLGVVPEAPSFVVDVSGSTSRGKTTTLTAGASVWANPRKGQHFVGSWDATPAYIEGLADCLRHLPLCLDDTRDAKDPAALERLIYTYAGESGRGRARPDGLRASLEVRGVLLSTGEQPITSFGSGGGARARSLCLRGWPLGEHGHTVALEIAAATAEHHGVAGPEVVRWLLARRGLWPKVRKAWQDNRAEYAARAASSVGQRLAAVLATLGAGAFAAHEILGLPKPSQSPMDFAVRAADQQADDADRGALAVAAVYGWACAHPSEFWGRESRDRSTGEARQPSLGWAGRWMPSTQTKEWHEIAWMPGCLSRVLEYEGFRPDEILSAWIDRKWLKMDGAHMGHKRTVGENGKGASPRCIVLSREVIEQVVGPTEETRGE